MIGSERPRRGDLVAGKYLIDEVLGEGGMGVVFGAVHQITRRRVALKWMFPWISQQRSGRARFLREARAAGQIEHPNVIEVLDVVEHGNSIFIVMEYLTGESYRSVLERRKLTTQRAIEILIPAMQGVAAVNARGTIHRDLKPDNIFLCRNPDGKSGPVKVLDFGVSKLIDVEQTQIQTITEDGSIVGTPAYMSPEQVRGERDLDERVDVYSFGVMLYESFSGTLPFEGKTSNALLIQVATQDAIPLRRVRPDVPVALEGIVARAMARNRSDRYANLKELIDALTSFSRDGSSTIGSTPSRCASDVPATLSASVMIADSRTTKRVKRHVIIAASVAVFALVAMLVGYFIYKYSPLPTPSNGQIEPTAGPSNERSDTLVSAPASKRGPSKDASRDDRLEGTWKTRASSVTTTRPASESAPVKQPSKNRPHRKMKVEEF